MRVNAETNRAETSKTEGKKESRSKKTDSSKKNSTASSSTKTSATTEEKDTNVTLSEKVKPKIESAPVPTDSKAIAHAEMLMDHVESGKLSGKEQDLALKRVGDLVKRYEANH